MKFKDWDEKDLQKSAQGEQQEKAMSGQAPEDDGHWEETEVESKPGVAYRWKKFALDSESDESAKAPGRGQGKEEDEGWEEELPPLKPWAKVLIFLGLAVVAAIICAFLWRFAHPEKPDGGESQDSSAQATEALEDSSVEAPKLDLDGPGEGEEQPEGTEESGAEPGPEQSGTDAASEAGAGMESGPEQPGADNASGAGTEPGAGTAPGPDAGAGTESAPSQPQEEEQEPVAGTEGMTFQAVQESVTPKDVVNLRLVPNTADADNIVTQARNGETLSRIGINSSTGWSQIDYNGQILYAVTQFLTTDLSYKPAVQPSDPNRVGTISGRIIIFKNCDDWISPKEYVNLRTEPSTTEGDATVSCQLNHGEKVHRTGYSTDSGWSRVEYNGQVLYVVTSLMYEVPAE